MIAAVAVAALVVLIERRIGLEVGAGECILRSIMNAVSSAT
jgi:hypothetical protein